MKKALLLVLIVVVLAAVVWFAGKPLIEKYSANRELVNLDSYLGVSGGGDAAALLGGASAPGFVFVRDGAVYWSADEVREILTENFWYSLDEGVLLLTTADEVVRAEEGKTSYTRHAEVAPADGVVPETIETAAPVFLIKDGRAYIALDYVRQFSNFTYQLFTEPYRVQIYASDETYDAANVRRKTALRTGESIKSGVVRELGVGEMVYVLNRMDEWSLVRTNDALTGFVENRRLTESFQDTVRIPTDYTPPPYTELTSPQKLCIAWHGIWSAGGNAGLEDLTLDAWPLDVISPTWYIVADSSGAVNSLAANDYVGRAHARGLQVWALVSDFTSGLDKETLLASTASRNAFVSYMINQANTLGFDGINLDFELVPEASGRDFEQLLRELSVACRAHGLVFSIDNYPPRDHTEHYNRKLQGEIADYVIIMGYDEHWGVSSGTGSVASLSYVEEAIQLTLAQDVPARKTINAVPFYTRIWSTARDGTVRESAVGIDAQNKWIEDRELEPIWSEELGQHYTQTDENKKLYQIWLEDEDSMRTRMEMMENYDLGGVAAWRLGLENAAFWNILGAYTRGGGH